MKVVQLSSVHYVFDNRIFNKISKSLVNHGYDVDLLIQHTKDEVVEGVNIIALPKVKGKLSRLFKVLPALFKKALEYPSKTIFHFHDPELIPVGLLLKFFGYKVIYDIHEDVITDIEQKYYLGPLQKKISTLVLKKIENEAHKKLITIIAETYYVERFPDAIEVLNYPTLNWAKDFDVDRESPNRVLYTGSITEDRGAFIHVNILNYMDENELSGINLIGSCNPALYKRLIESVGEEKSRLFMNGDGKSVPFKSIIKSYSKADWLAGLAIFPKTKHYSRKRLTKLFEYMAAGLPIIYTDFSAWKNFLEPLNVGIAVNPEDSTAIKQAILRLKTEDALRLQMSENGKKAVRNIYNWAKEEEKLLTLYNNLTKA
ncbi:MAG: glycosyltransferase [Balneola sp.]|nr:glycosyltransferase [Balneola sp.]MBO6650274.1 glycosyltransferase [Balneola sp.]MBO6712140.1 glycosyltransferase [Balneola sp.]MBO6800334.1 glycosyltransferase [Balneola sp.]MBO6869652.1 glycosyltransferase [Balneola sp.]